MQSLFLTKYICIIHFLFFIYVDMYGFYNVHHPFYIRWYSSIITNVME